MHVKLDPQYKNSCYIICFLIVLIAKFAIRKYSAHDKRQAKIYLIGIQLPPKGFPPGGRGSGCGLRRTLYVPPKNAYLPHRRPFGVRKLSHHDALLRLVDALFSRSRRHVQRLSRAAQQHFC